MHALIWLLFRWHAFTAVLLLKALRQAEQAARLRIVVDKVVARKRTVSVRDVSELVGLTALSIFLIALQLGLV